MKTDSDFKKAVQKAKGKRAKTQSAPKPKKEPGKEAEKTVTFAEEEDSN